MQVELPGFPLMTKISQTCYAFGIIPQVFHNTLLLASATLLVLLTPHDADHFES